MGALIALGPPLAGPGSNFNNNKIEKQQYHIQGFLGRKNPRD